MSAEGSLTFLLDNNLSKKLADGMKAFGEDVVHLQDLFEPDISDTVLLEHLGKSGYILITRDLAIRKHPAELAALRDNQVGAFFLAGKERKRCQLIQQLVRNWPRIKELAGKRKKPYAFRVPPSGAKVTPVPL